MKNKRGLNNIAREKVNQRFPSDANKLSFERERDGRSLITRTPKRGRPGEGRIDFLIKSFCWEYYF